MNGGIRIVGSDGNFELRQNFGGFVGGFAVHRQSTDALAVKAETLGKRRRHKKAQSRLDKQVNDRTVFGNAMAKTLVGHV